MLVKIAFFTLISLVLCDDPNRLPTKCEICKYLSESISDSLNEHDSSDVISISYSLDDRLSKRNAKKYRDSETRLIEVIESVCDKILTYNVHAEREGSLRYGKGESQTMQTLKNLRQRGVKVELGIPDDLWDTPSAEITNLKRHCDQMVELNEEVIEDWFLNHRDNTTLQQYLCESRVLVGEDSCKQSIINLK